VRAILPDYVYRGGRFEAGLAVLVSESTGRIVDVVPAWPRSADRPAGAAAHVRDALAETIELPGRALLPGFVNAHSHAFQRLLRGRTQWRPSDSPEADFWSWRDAMYRIALALSPEDVFDVARFCFLEMLRAGITTVGEFHYLQRDPDGRRYADPLELARRVLAAADEVGIRIVLLNACYAAGGIGQPLGPLQRRFATSSLAEYLSDTTALGAAAAGSPRASVGIAPHSVRAVPRDWLPGLHEAATRGDVALHMHVSEQPAEVDECLAAYRLRPVELLADEGLLDAGFTAVHATHITPNEVRLLGQAGACVCACPTTESDLGDGFLLAGELLQAGAHFALGTDSQTLIDFFAEMRLLEYHERLRRLRRVVLTRAEPAGRIEVAPLLLEIGTAGGARSLRLDTGRIEAGALADVIAVDLAHPTLAGWTPHSLAAMLALCAPSDAVTDVWVHGVRRVAGREHSLQEPAARAFARVAARVG
jgi:formimidoylglutamate deiminase